MKLVIKNPDANYLRIQKNLLEENGIPAFINGEDTARMITPFIMTEPSLWVYVDEQVDEARKLVDDPEYEVINKVDIHDFYKEVETAQKPSVLNNALLHLGFSVIVFMLGLYLVIKIMEWFAS